MCCKAANNLARSSVLMLLLKSRPEIKPLRRTKRSHQLCTHIHLYTRVKQTPMHIEICNVLLDMCFCLPLRDGCKTYNSIVRGDPESRHANCARPDCDLMRPRKRKEKIAMAGPAAAFQRERVELISFCAH